MDQPIQKPEQPQGRFVMNLNFKRGANPKAPPITGRISTPEDPETEFSFSAFEHADKNGEIYWIGPVDTTTSMRTALTTTPKPGHNFVTVRMNGFKVFKENIDGTPNAAYAALSPEQQKLEDSKPSFWGTWTRDPENQPILRHSAWDREPNRYGPWASGTTQHPITKEQTAMLEAGHSAEAAPYVPEPIKPIRRRGKEGEGRTS